MAVALPAIFAFASTIWLPPVLRPAVLMPTRCLREPPAIWIPPVPRWARPEARWARPEVIAAGIRRLGVLEKIPAAAGMFIADMGPL